MTETIRDYARFWDEYSQKWVAQEGSQFLGCEWGEVDQSAREIIEAGVKPGMKVLEIGSGGGRYTELLLKAAGVKNVDVVDVSESMLARIQERFGENVGRFLTDGSSLAGVQTLKLYDFVFSFDALVHVDFYDIMKMVLDLKGLATMGATCVLHHSNVESTFGFEHWISIRKYLEGQNQAGCFSVNSPRIMRNALRYYGFQVVSQLPVRAGRDTITTFTH
jgi:2-polyprenyl-3-methyl-5-hydroxy-6-metoxy-1,4-benzoquinol methylase